MSEVLRQVSELCPLWKLGRLGESGGRSRRKCFNGLKLGKKSWCNRKRKEQKISTTFCRFYLTYYFFPFQIFLWINVCECIAIFTNPFMVCCQCDIWFLWMEVNHSTDCLSFLSGRLWPETSNQPFCFTYFQMPVERLIFFECCSKMDEPFTYVLLCFSQSKFWKKRFKSL